MSEQTFASLNPTLLARKGGAKPAMRPQVAVVPDGGAAAHNLEDLGWNDMGDAPQADNDSKLLQLTPEPANAEAEAEAHRNDELAEADLANVISEKPAVVEQQEFLANKVVEQAAPETDSKPAVTRRKRRSALERGKRAAFTLRLDSDRHLKLRLACTLRSKSAQQLVTDALDSLLGDMPDVKKLAAQANTNE